MVKWPLYWCLYAYACMHVCMHESMVTILTLMNNNHSSMSPTHAYVVLNEYALVHIFTALSHITLLFACYFDEL